MMNPKSQHPEVIDLLQITDPAERARRANNVITEHQALINEVAQVRRAALEEMITAGMSQTDIGKELGMTRARVGQLLTSGPRPERMFLGSGTVITIAAGGKPDSGKREGQPKSLVSSEAMDAYERIAELARTLGLKPAPVEVVAPPGNVNLNRPGLIVLGGPRILPFVGQILEVDQHLGFGEDNNGRFLFDRLEDHEYRSPLDDGGRGVHGDYAYIGRLPRPDGRGTFLYLAGIHALGTKGAAHYIEANIERLYKDMTTRRFSVLIACEADPKTGDIISSHAVTPIHKHEGLG